VLDAASAADPRNYAVQTWSLKRSAQYGSKHYDETVLKVTAVKVAQDGKSVSLETADLKPTWGMEIKYSLKGAQGEAVGGVIHNTIHHLAD
jgi:hypothetical protein